MGATHYNSCVFTGKEEDLFDLIDSIHGRCSPLSFSRVLPVPPSLTRAEAAAWKESNWGAVPDIDKLSKPAEYEVGRNKISIFFTTSGNPTPVMEKIGVKFPKITTDCILSDRGVSYAARFVFHGGRKVYGREYDDADTDEASLLFQGVRVEEVFSTRNTMGILPTPYTRAVDEAGLRGEASTGATPEDLSTPDSFKGRLRAENALGRAAQGELVQRLCEAGFPYSEWRDSGFFGGDFWNRTGRLLMPARLPDQSHCLASKQDGLPEIRLADSRGQPDLSRGCVHPLDNGLKFISPGGWGVCVLFRKASKFQRRPQARIIVTHGGGAQNSPSMTPAETVLEVDPADGNVWVAAKVFCSSGELWDPVQGEPALTLFNRDGKITKTIHFKDGNHVRTGDDSVQNTGQTKGLHSPFARAGVRQQDERDLRR